MGLGPGEVQPTSARKRPRTLRISEFDVGDIKTWRIDNGKRKVRVDPSDLSTGCQKEVASGTYLGAALNKTEVSSLLSAFSHCPEKALSALFAEPSALSILASVVSSVKISMSVNLVALRALLLSEAFRSGKASFNVLTLPDSLARYTLTCFEVESPENAHQFLCFAVNMYKAEMFSTADLHAPDVIGLDVDVQKYMRSGADLPVVEIPNLEALTEALTVAFILTESAIIDTVEDYIICFSHNAFCKALAGIMQRWRLSAARMISITQLIGMYCRTHLYRSISWKLVIEEPYIGQLFLHADNLDPGSTLTRISTPEDTALGSLCIRLASYVQIQRSYVPIYSSPEVQHGKFTVGKDVFLSELHFCITILAMRLSWLLLRTPSSDGLQKKVLLQWVRLVNQLSDIVDEFKSHLDSSDELIEVQSRRITMREWRALCPGAFSSTCSRHHGACNSLADARVTLPRPAMWITWELHYFICTEGARDRSGNHGADIRNYTHERDMQHFTTIFTSAWSQVPLSPKEAMRAILTGFIRARSHLLSARNRDKVWLCVPPYIHHAICSVAKFGTLPAVCDSLDELLRFARKCDAMDGLKYLSADHSQTVTGSDSVGVALHDRWSFTRQVTLCAVSCFQAPWSSANVVQSETLCSMKMWTSLLRKSEAYLSWLSQSVELSGQSFNLLKPLAFIVHAGFQESTCSEFDTQHQSWLALAHRFPRSFKLMKQILYKDKFPFVQTQIAIAMEGAS